MSENPIGESGKDNSSKDWSGTTKRAAIVVAIDIIILVMGLELRNYQNINLGWTIAAIGIITFFGMLSVSSYHKRHLDEKSDKGTMRDALAASLICTYFVVLAFSMFEKINSGNTSVDSLLTSFSSVIMIMVGFYFGSKGAVEIYKHKADMEERKKGETQKTSKTIK